MFQVTPGSKLAIEFLFQGTASQQPLVGRKEQKSCLLDFFFGFKRCHQTLDNNLFNK